MRIQAAVLRQPGLPPPYAESKPLEIIELDLAPPGRGEVQVKIAAAGLADGAKREAQTFARSQMERMMAGMNVVTREEFEAVKEMAARARDENEKLATRVASLEAKLNEPRL